MEQQAVKEYVASVLWTKVYPKTVECCEITATLHDANPGAYFVVCGFIKRSENAPEKPNTLVRSWPKYLTKAEKRQGKTAKYSCKKPITHNIMESNTKQPLEAATSTMTMALDFW